MWFKQYKDYKIDDPLVKQRVGPNRGIVGCQMADLHGWGEGHHYPKGEKISVPQSPVSREKK